MDEKIREIFQKEFGEYVKFDESTTPYTTFKVGGLADIFIKVKDEKAVKKVFELSRKYNLHVFILGGGSNILISDKGIRGIVIKNEINRIKKEGNRIICGSGSELKKLIDYCLSESMSGLEFLSGIYGTVGGAVFGNAGAYGQTIGDKVWSVKIIDSKGREKRLLKNNITFMYRKMVLEPGINHDFPFFVIEVDVELEKGSHDEIKNEMDRILLERNGKMPDPLPSAGCFFKNVENPSSCFTVDKGTKLSAGKLLEEIGAKKMANDRVGVHELHANIVMNKGGAKASEIIEFTEKLKKKVFDKFGIMLEREIKTIGEF